jgi:hypothetical protein
VNDATGSLASIWRDLGTSGSTATVLSKPILAQEEKLPVRSAAAMASRSATSAKDSRLVPISFGLLAATMTAGSPCATRTVAVVP